MNAPLKISEITPMTIQGEGQFIGTPVIFVRAFGCDYKCKGCDTPYASDKDYTGKVFEFTVDEIMEKIDITTKGNPCLVTLTGGNPCLQDFSELLMTLAGNGYTTSIETQGSLFPFWLSDLDFMTLSPKAPNSGNVTQIGNIIRCIDTFGKHRSYSICIKIVVAGQQDLDYAEQMFVGLTQHYGHNGMTFCVQPFNGRPNPAIQELKQNYMELAIEVFRRQMYYVKVLPQLHVWLHGNKRGV